MKPSRLLLSLEARIKSARTTFEADCLRAERATYLARIGQFDEVRSELAALHERYDARPNVEISAWINLVEGLTIYFSAMALPTNDKVARSLALSSAAGLKSLQAISSAWSAQFDYGKVSIDSMLQHVRMCLKVSSSDHHSARSRASLVVAQALHLAARPDLALPWYQKARNHAVAEGDDATTSAIMHNMGWLRMMMLRQSILSAKVAFSSDNHALMNAESTNQFDALIGDTTWDALKPILRAQVLSLSGDFAAALVLYRRYLSDADHEGINRLQSNLLADKAWCLMMSGQIDLARETATLAANQLTFEMHHDDRAAAHSRLSQVFSYLENSAEEKKQLRLAKEAWGNHEMMQMKIVLLFQTLTDQGAV